MDIITLGYGGNLYEIECNIQKESTIIDSPLNQGYVRNTVGSVIRSGNYEYLRTVTLKATNVSYVNNLIIKDFVMNDIVFGDNPFSVTTNTYLEVDTGEARFLNKSTSGLLTRKTNDVYDLSFSYSYRITK